MNRSPRRGVVALSLAIATLMASTALADNARLFDYKQIELDNGLKVVTLEDFSCPVVVVQVWYHVGSRNERPDRQGFAHMFEHMMFRGTELLEPKEHVDLVQGTGGECNAGTSFDHTAYINRLPANQLDLALWLEAERMAFLAVNQENFDVERKVVEEELRMYRNNPYGTLPDKALAELFKVHPYRWLVSGQIPHLRAASVQELRDFWSTYYVPNNATLIIVGAVKHEDAQRLARKYFGWITRGDDPPTVDIREPMPTKARRVTFKEDKAPAPAAGIIYRTVPAAHEDYVPLQLLATILGGGESSRIYRDLVADTQDAAMAAAMAFSLEDDGILTAAAILPPFGGKPVDEILDRISAHIEKLRAEPVSERELTKARNQMLAGVVLPQLTIMSKARALGDAATTLGNVARVNQQLDEIRAVTAADLQRVAQEYLAPERALLADVKANLLGTLFGGKKDDDGEVTAEPELEAPAPGRPGVVRPTDFPTEPPIAALSDVDTAADFSERKLPNGMTVIVVPNHEVPYVSVQLGLRSGAYTEDKPGTASLALGMLTKGTAKHDEGELADELETYAISLGGSAGMDTCSVSLGVLTEQLERGMELMGEVVLTPTFPADEFEKMVTQLRTALAMSEATPEYHADRELRRALFGEHPYAREADPESGDLDALSASDLQQWWRKFARPDDATVIFAGDITADRAVALAKSTFGQWRAEGPAPEITLPPIPKPQATHILLVDRSGAQSQIRIGQLGITRTHPDYFVSRVVNGYFGGGFSGRLMESIRQEKGLSYGAGGGYRTGRFAGRFVVTTFSKTARTAEAVRALLDEVERLRTEPPTADELKLVKSYVMGSFVGDRETPQDVAGDIWLLRSSGLDSDYFDRLLDGVAETTAEDCSKLVNETVDPQKMVVVVVGSAKKLKDDLEKIAPVTVIRPNEKPGDQASADAGAGTP